MVPSAIVQAVFDGHRYARELDEDPNAGTRYRVEPLPSIHGTASGCEVYS